MIERARKGEGEEEEREGEGAIQERALKGEERVVGAEEKEATKLQCACFAGGDRRRRAGTELYKTRKASCVYIVSAVPFMPFKSSCLFHSILYWAKKNEKKEDGLIG